jgi:hypothetical protein
MNEHIDLLPGDAFLFRYHAHWWQLWRRGYGGAKVIALEPYSDIVHLSILSMEDIADKSIINHIPITLPHVLLAYVQNIPAEKQEWRDTSHAWQNLAEWREVAKTGEAAAFDLPLREALLLICKTWSELGGDSSEPMRIASAYPVRGTKGKYSAVRVISWHKEI